MAASIGASTVCIPSSSVRPANDAPGCSARALSPRTRCVPYAHNGKVGLASAVRAVGEPSTKMENAFPMAASLAGHAISTFIPKSNATTARRCSTHSAGTQLKAFWNQPVTCACIGSAKRSAAPVAGGHASLQENAKARATAPPAFPPGILRSSRAVIVASRNTTSAPVGVRTARGNAFIDDCSFP